jgi:hypothetical protein
MVHCEPEHVGTDSCVLNCLKYSEVSALAFYAISALVGTEYINIQGGSNMTGTNCDLFTHNQSRSYLNHLVFNTVHGHETTKS